MRRSFDRSVRGLTDPAERGRKSRVYAKSFTG